MSSSSSNIPKEPVPQDEDCDCDPCPLSQGGDPGNVTGSGGVRAFNGKVVLSTEADLQAAGFSIPFSTQLRYDNKGGGASWGFGSNWVPANGLAGLTFDDGTVLYHEGPNAIKTFLPLGGGTYEPTYLLPQK